MCDVFLCLFTFPYGVPGQVWYLIISIPDLCLLPYLAECTIYVVCFVIHRFMGVPYLSDQEVAGLILP